MGWLVDMQTDSRQTIVGKIENGSWVDIGAPSCCQFHKLVGGEAEGLSINVLNPVTGGRNVPNTDRRIFSDGRPILLCPVVARVPFYPQPRFVGPVSSVFLCFVCIAIRSHARLSSGSRHVHW